MKERYYGQRRFRVLRTLAFSGLLLWAVVYIFSARNYTNHHVFVIKNEHQLTLPATRGETITLLIPVEDGIAGHWSSVRGLFLTLPQLPPLMVVEPKEGDWGKSFKASTSQMRTFHIKGTFTIPSSIGGAEEQMLSGTLFGSIIYPKGGFVFANQTLHINVPVQIHLMPPGNALVSGGGLFLLLSAGLLLLWSIGILLWIAGAGVGALIRRRNPLSGYNQQRTPTLGRALLGSIIPAILWTLLFFALINIFTFYEILAIPDSVFFCNMLLPSFMGVSCLPVLVAGKLTG